MVINRISVKVTEWGLLAVSCRLVSNVDEADEGLLRQGLGFARAIKGGHMR